MSPVPSVARVIARPSECSRVTRKLPDADDVAGVGVVALVEDPGGGGEGARHRDPREALQLVLLEVGEERHAAQ